ncbi:hypothetical protein [Companilactobacillus furfuricola]|uniref:hypothetical protein n=1 Tax=Companilactobacillus furfuricola TaxID=1462575 RepID=UPI0013DDB931|nr:hypothetical protein [Companilactobacillus furfuricola]
MLLHKQHQVILQLVTTLLRNKLERQQLLKPAVQHNKARTVIINQHLTKQKKLSWVKQLLK